MTERMDEWTNGRMDEWTNGRMDEWTNGRLGRMDEWLLSLLSQPIVVLNAMIGSLNILKRFFYAVRILSNGSLMLFNSSNAFYCWMQLTVVLSTELQCWTPHTNAIQHTAVNLTWENHTELHCSSQNFTAVRHTYCIALQARINEHESAK